MYISYWRIKTELFHLRALQISDVCRLGDADAMIVSAVLDHACTGDNVEIIASDTDLLIMLVYFWNSLMGQIIMKTEATKNHKAIECDIGVIAACIGDVGKYLTFVHAFGGCDTTSAVYGQVKLSILKLLENLKGARVEADVFLQKNISPRKFVNWMKNICHALWRKKF